LLTIQSTKLPPDIEYAIDCQTEYGEIDAGTTLALRCYGDRPTIIAILDRTQVDYLVRRRTCDELRAYAATVIAEMTPQQQGAIAAMGIAHVRHLCNETTAVMAQWAISDRVEGGCAEAWNHPIRARSDGVTPFKRDLRRLCAPTWIRRYVKRDPQTLRHRTMFNQIAGRAAHLPRAVITGGFSTFEADYDEMRRRQADHEREVWANARDLVAADYVDNLGDAIKVKIKPGVKKKLRKHRTRQRKVIRRAAATCAAFVGADTVMRLSRNEPVILEGQAVNFKVAPYGSLAQRGHSALAIECLDKDGNKLAGLCLYFDDTPALDQVTAIKMHLDAGCEHELIEAGNLTWVSEKGITHPAIQAKREAALAAGIVRAAEIEAERRANPEPEEAEVDRRIRRIVRHENLNELRDVRNEAYWNLTGPIWKDAMGVYVFGREWRHLQ
jgi:hypothetical protein